MKRFMLIACVLCILTASLVVSSGTVHAQSRTSLAPQHTMIAADSGSTYSFYGGSWGWGFCLSHNATQGFGDGGGYWRGLVEGFISAKFGGWQGFIAFAVVEGIAWYLQRIVDHGRGVCVGFVWGSPAAPWAWSQ